jgi:soluble lytic murein transglycosylase-like protein
MQKRVFTILAGSLLFLGQAPISSAEDKIQAFVNQKGKIVFTNLVDNGSAPAPAAEPQMTDVLANEIPTPLKSLVDSISKTHGVDSGLVRALIKTESNFNRYAVSPKGARGLMQLMPETGRRLGVRDFFDPHQNVDAGVRHLKFLLNKFDGNIDLSLAAYNAGENLVERIGRIPNYPETKNYVRKIRTLYANKSAPVPLAQATEVTPVAATEPAAATAQTATVQKPQIFKAVDQRGVVYFSNIEPPK